MKKIYSILSISFLSFGIVQATSPGQTAGNNISVSGNQKVQSYQSVLSKSGSNTPKIKSGTKTTTPLARMGHGGQNQINTMYFSDSFDGSNDTISLQGRGYKTYYRGGGTPGTAPCWFQGATNVFTSFNGPAGGYVASNFQSVTAVNNVDNWLILPALNVNTGTLLSFYSRSPTALPNPAVDSIHVYYSASGDSTPEGLTWVLLGEYEVNTFAWQYSEFIIPSASATGRLAIRYAVVDGGPSGMNSNYIGIDQIEVKDPSQYDGGITEITAPQSGCSLSSTEQVTIEVANVGADTLRGFDLSFSVDGGAPVIESFPDSIVPGDTITYSFTGTADLSAGGVHAITANFILAADSNATNNSYTDSLISIIPAPDPLNNLFSMDFELSDDLLGWINEDVNADGTSWELLDTLAYRGDFCMVKFSSQNDDDDYLYTKCIDMSAGTNYTLDYYYMDYDLTAPCLLEVKIGNAQSYLSMTQTLQTHSAPLDTTYQHGIAAGFTVPISGTYYIGFHAFSGSPTSAILLDYIHLDDGTWIGVNEGPKKYFTISPNPTNGVFAIRSSTIIKNAEIEIFDMNGRLVYKTHENEMFTHTLDLSKLPAGIYNLRLASNTFVENQRIVLNK